MERLYKPAEAEPRKHPDLFTPEEAAAYMHLDSVRGLETLREKYDLIGYAGVNKALMYYREDLDACALRMVDRDKTGTRMRGNGALRIAGARG